LVDLIQPKPETYHGLPAATLVPAMPGLTLVFVGPIYGLIILACLIIAVAQVGRFNLRRPSAVRYAVTSARLLAMDASGALVDQLEGSEIADIRIDHPDTARGLTVRSKPGESHRGPFVMLYADQLAEAKATIEETFLPAPD